MSKYSTSIAQPSSPTCANGIEAVPRSANAAEPPPGSLPMGRTSTRSPSIRPVSVMLDTADRALTSPSMRISMPCPPTDGWPAHRRPLSAIGAPVAPNASPVASAPASACPEFVPRDPAGRSSDPAGRFRDPVGRSRGPAGRFLASGDGPLVYRVLARVFPDPLDAPGPVAQVGGGHVVAAAVDFAVDVDRAADGRGQKYRLTVRVHAKALVRAGVRAIRARVQHQALAASATGGLAGGVDDLAGATDIGILPGRCEAGACPPPQQQRHLHPSAVSCGAECPVRSPVGAHPPTRSIRQTPLPWREAAIS